jgi:hypothetical protein
VVLVDFLRANADIFAWSPSDMPGIPREVAEHSLDILPHSRASDNPPKKIPYYHLNQSTLVIKR